MSPAADPVALLAARVDRLERENRRLRRLVARSGIVVLALAAPALLAYVPANDRIEASEFVVRDRSGASRARLFVDDAGRARLVLRDRDGRSVAELVSHEGATLSLGDKDARSTVIMSASSARGLLVVESEGKPRSVLAPPKPIDGKDPLDAQDPWSPHP